MVDKNGKLFGLINLFDFLVICLLAVALAVAAYFYFGRGVKVSGNDLAYELVIIADFVPNYVAEAIKIESPAKEEYSGVSLGTVSNIEILDGFEYVVDKDGIVHKAYKENCKTVKVTTRLKAGEFDGGIVIDGNKFSVGQSFSFIAGDCKYMANIYAFRRID